MIKCIYQEPTGNIILKRWKTECFPPKIRKKEMYSLTTSTQNCTGGSILASTIRHLSAYTKINSKCTVGLNVKSKTIKLLGENIRESLCELWVSQNFLVPKPKAQWIKEKSW